MVFGIVFFYCDFGVDVFFGDVEFFFYIQFDRQIVGVLFVFVFYVLFFYIMVVIKKIFYGMGYYVVDIGFFVG